MVLPPVTESLATLFSTSSISGTMSFLDRIAWRRQTRVDVRMTWNTTDHINSEHGPI